MFFVAIGFRFWGSFASRRRDATMRWIRMNDRNAKFIPLRQVNWGKVVINHGIRAVEFFS